MKRITGILSVTLLLACSSQPNHIEQGAQDIPLIRCPEQRPQVCTMDYRPVCATLDTGVRCITTPCPSSEQKTYSNACTACADSEVLGYTPEKCEPVAEQQSSRP